MKMLGKDVLSDSDTSYSEKNSEFSHQELNLRSSAHWSDALPLSYRRLVEAYNVGHITRFKCDKSPAAQW